MFFADDGQEKFTKIDRRTNAKKKLVIHENFFLLRRILSNPDNDLRVDLKGSIDLLQYYRTNVFKTDLYHS